MTAVSQSQACLTFLQGFHSFPISKKVVEANFKKREERFSFILSLLEVFGKYYLQSICERFNPVTVREVKEVYEAYFEIENNILAERFHYNPSTYQKVQQVIQKYGSINQSEESLFAVLRNHFYRSCLFFPQQVWTLLGPSSKEYRELEDSRLQAVSDLIQKLDCSHPLGSLPPKRELAVTRLYFSQGAVFFGAKGILFSELITQWGSFNQENSTAVAQFLEQLPAAHWGLQSTRSSDFLFPPITSNFRCFLIQSSIEAIQKNLDFSFSSPLQERFRKLFNDERVRSDVSYFTGNQRQFYEIDFSSLKRSSAPVLRSIQAFFFLARSTGCSQDDLNSLLALLIHRDEADPLEEIPGFKGRGWEKDLVDRKDPVFKEAWEGMEALFSAVARRVVNLSEPLPLDHELLRQSESWKLFLFLWKNEKRGLFVDALLPFIKDSRFSMTISGLYRFCKAAESTIDYGNALCCCYYEILNLFEEYKIEVQSAQALFFDPPIQNLTLLKSIDDLIKNGKTFILAMSNYPFPVNSHYFFLLRRYIFAPYDYLFDLISDFKFKEVDEAFLWSVLSFEHQPVSLPISEEVRKQCKEKAFQLQKRYLFSDTETFFIYLELIRLTLGKQEEVFDEVSQAVAQLEELCPALGNKEVYFLFRYHPIVLVERTAHLIELRTSWAQNKEQLNRFIIQQKKWREIVDAISSFIEIVAKSSSDEREQEKFKATCGLSLFGSFFPPLQPLTDYFRISNLTIEGGVKWRSPELKTHLGQLKPVLKNANLSIYFHWDIIHDNPTLLISFFDLKRGSAHSAFLPIYVSASEMESHERSAPFYFLLFNLSQLVLGEESHQDPGPEGKETPDDWMNCYVGAREELAAMSEEVRRNHLTEEGIREMWDFLRRTKVSFRTLFLSASACRSDPVLPSYKRSDVVTSGHIFPSYPRGALIPASLLDTEPHPEFYLPDASQSFVLNCADQQIFGKETDLPLLLNLSLKVKGGEFPVFYQVQSAESLTEMKIDEMDEKRWHDKAPPLMNVQGSYVTLSIKEPALKIPLRYPAEVLNHSALFQKYFDYHNLLLKSLFYYTKSRQARS